MCWVSFLTVSLEVRAYECFQIDAQQEVSILGHFQGFDREIVKSGVVQTEALYEGRNRVACLEFTDGCILQCLCSVWNKDIENWQMS